MTEYFVVDDVALCYQNDTHKDYNPIRYNVLNEHESKRTTIWYPTKVRVAKVEDFEFFRIALPPDYLTMDNGGVYSPDIFPKITEKATEDKSNG